MIPVKKCNLNIQISSGLIQQQNNFYNGAQYHKRYLHHKDIYWKLGKKIDGTTIRTPRNQALFEIFKALYTSREAELLVKRFATDLSCEYQDKHEVL